MAIRRLRVKVGDRWYTVEVDQPMAYPVNVRVDGETYLVEYEAQQTRLPSVTPRTSTSGKISSIPSSDEASGLISSPMSGKVVSVGVKLGDVVESGQEVCVVEAMKMEQSIRAPKSGRVTKVHVEAAQEVNIHQPLVELE